MNARWRLGAAMVIGALSLGVVGSAGAQVREEVGDSAPTSPSEFVGLSVGMIPCKYSKGSLYDLTPKCAGDVAIWPTISNPVGTKYEVSSYLGRRSFPVRFRCDDSGKVFSWNAYGWQTTLESSHISVNGRISFCVSSILGIGLTWAGTLLATHAGLSSTPVQAVWDSDPSSLSVPWVRAQLLTNAIKVSWAGISPSSTTTDDAPVPNGRYTAIAFPGGQWCSTSRFTCVISGLDSDTAQSVGVLVDTTDLPGPIVMASGAGYPIPAGRLSLKASPIPSNGALSALVYGTPAHTYVKVGVPGSQTSCVTNAFGQCTVTLSESTVGSHTVLALDSRQSATASLWVPAIIVPPSIRHGRSFLVSIHNAPPKAAISIATSDKRTIKATTNSAGGASVSVSTKTPEFLTLTVTIAGTSFPAYNVQVS